MKPVIKIEKLAKQYRLGSIGTGTIRDDFQRWWHWVRGKEDPFSKVGEINDRHIKGKNSYVWALKDIDFEVMPGEVLGIIGKNGAGKSTLLKILSKVTGPTRGRVSYNGRIGCLLEVGTGFHPDLTGRENIFLNGAILGMTKREIHTKLDEIIEFSGCERYIDTPVKRYSSGMTVRLGFSVAAHLNPEILIVDEVLAVGDAEFQKKAIGKMQDVSWNEGRTVLFVSHNMGLIKQLCNRGIVLKEGSIEYSGSINESINYYMFQQNSSCKQIIETIAIKHNDIVIDRVEANGNLNRDIIISGYNNYLTIHIEGYLKNRMKFCFELYLLDENEVPIALYIPDFTYSKIKEYQKGNFTITEKVKLPEKLNKGKYYVSVNLADPLKEFFVTMHKALIIECDGYTNASGYAYSYNDAGFCLLG